VFRNTRPQREYTDRDGTARQSLDVRAREMRMLDKAGEGGNSGGGFGDEQSQSSGARDVWTQPRPSSPSGSGDGAGSMDDIPF